MSSPARPRRCIPARSCAASGSAHKSTYDAIHDNPDISCQPVDLTNLPHLIIQNDRLTAINNTTQMDLQGQAASESNGHRHISGTGGQLQFVRGAYASNGGKSFLCMSSTYERHGDRRSRVVLNLTPGNIVTAPRSDMMYVVTEYGLVNLKGKSIPERAKAMISLAHPDFRDDLERDARKRRSAPRRHPVSSSNLRSRHRTTRRRSHHHRLRPATSSAKPCAASSTSPELHSRGTELDGWTGREGQGTPVTHGHSRSLTVTRKPVLTRHATL